MSSNYRMTYLTISLKTIVNLSPVVLRHLKGDRKILSKDRS